MCIEPELPPIEVSHCGNRKFRVGLLVRKIVENINFCSHLEKDVDYAESHLCAINHENRSNGAHCAGAQGSKKVTGGRG